MVGLPPGTGLRASPATRVLVRSHIHQKLNVRNRAELVRRARETGLLGVEGAGP